VADRYLWGPDVAEVVDSAGAPTDSSLARDPANEKFFAGLDASTSIVTKLTTASGAAEMEPACPRWATGPPTCGGPGSRVGRTFAMNASGKGRVQVDLDPVPERDPFWSSNGTQIVYAARTAPGEPFRILRRQGRRLGSRTAHDAEGRFRRPLARVVARWHRIAYVSFEVGQGTWTSGR
jgi:hypothetical protein